jgi:hypothetical protein
LVKLGVSVGLIEGSAVAKLGLAEDELRSIRRELTVESRPPR